METNKPETIEDAYDTYSEYDISHEAYREIHYTNGHVHRIDDPVSLVIRQGGSTHRVVDAKGVVHCYVAPESGKCTLIWKSRNPARPMEF